MLVALNNPFSFTEWISGSSNDTFTLRALTVGQRVLQIALFALGIAVAAGSLTSLPVAIGCTLILASLSVTIITARIFKSSMERIHEHTDLLITIISTIFITIISIVTLSGGLPLTELGSSLYMPFIGIVAGMGAHLLTSRFFK